MCVQLRDVNLLAACLAEDTLCFCSDTRASLPTSSDSFNGCLGRCSSLARGHRISSGADSERLQCGDHLLYDHLRCRRTTSAPNDAPNPTLTLDHSRSSTSPRRTSWLP